MLQKKSRVQNNQFLQTFPLKKQIKHNKTKHILKNMKKTAFKSRSFKSTGSLYPPQPNMLDVLPRYEASLGQMRAVRDEAVSEREERDVRVVEMDEVNLKKRQ